VDSISIFFFVQEQQLHLEKVILVCHQVPVLLK
jgi:hypothetical protein